MSEAAELLRVARRAAALTQRELAARSGVAQAVIARVESGTTSPRVDTLSRLVRATGHRLSVVPDADVDVDRVAIRRLLALSDLERERHFVEGNANILRLFAEARLT